MEKKKVLTVDSNTSSTQLSLDRTCRTTTIYRLYTYSFQEVEQNHYLCKFEVYQLVLSEINLLISSSPHCILGAVVLGVLAKFVGPNHHISKLFTQKRFSSKIQLM